MVPSGMHLLVNEKKKIFRFRHKQLFDLFINVTGGMQDYNYVYASCMEITLELSCCKYPPREQLPDFWQQVN